MDVIDPTQAPPPLGPQLGSPGMGGYYAFRWPDEEKGPWVVRLYTNVIEGREEVIGVALWHGFKSEPITATLLRQFPIGSLIQDRQRLAKENSERVIEEILEIDSDEIRAIRESWEAYRSRLTAKRRRYPPEHWKKVAAVYNDAWSRGSPPTRAVAEAFPPVTRSTAGKWVHTCRLLGLLPKTDPRKAKGGSA